jgi:hypothetical protein
MRQAFDSTAGVWRHGPQLATTDSARGLAFSRLPERRQSRRSGRPQQSNLAGRYIRHRQPAGHPLSKETVCGTEHEPGDGTPGFRGQNSRVGRVMARVRLARHTALDELEERDLDRRGPASPGKGATSGTETALPVLRESGHDLDVGCRCRWLLVPGQTRSRQAATSVQRNRASRRKPGLASSRAEDGAYSCSAAGVHHHAGPVRRSDQGEGDRAVGLALTIQIVAKRSSARVSASRRMRSPGRPMRDAHIAASRAREPPFRFGDLRMQRLYATGRADRLGRGRRRARIWAIAVPNRLCRRWYVRAGRA